MWIKICGITSEEDALLAVALGADAVGFVFAPSTRQVNAIRVRSIVERLPREILTVGVFRDESVERVIDTVWSAGLRAAQLHGHETPAVTNAVRAQVPFVIQAFSAGSRSIAQAEDHGADLVLVDAASPGGGKVFDWSVLSEVPAHLPLVLAGGLDPSNVADAIARVRPYGVDVSSGVEASPGHKDPLKMRAFINAARQAAERLERADTADRDGHRHPQGTTSDFYDWSVDG